jgi:hypothetical protein
LTKNGWLNGILFSSTESGKVKFATSGTNVTVIVAGVVQKSQDLNATKVEEMI